MQILDAFNFDSDHPFGFYDNIKNVYQSREKYELFNELDDMGDVEEDKKGVSEIPINTVFTVEKKMIFLFDYGDNWEFLVHCTTITDPEPRKEYPRIVKKVGRAPQQDSGRSMEFYHNWE